MQKYDIHMQTTILEYEFNKYPFYRWACNVLQISCLDQAHRERRVKASNRGPTFNQLTSSFEMIKNVYHDFLLEVLVKQVGEIATYQCPPSFRFHYCGLGSSVFHSDREFGVEDGRINVCVPLTPVWGDNSLWIESKVGSGQYEAVNMKPGQLLIFDGVNLRHGSKTNSTAATRISFDLRFLPGQGPAVPTSY